MCPLHMFWLFNFLFGFRVVRLFRICRSNYMILQGGANQPQLQPIPALAIVFHVFDRVYVLGAINR